ncbi:effector-associated constant component EACC1 [Nocardia vinacea]|uniref:effector-associated constant component EACC1 n=1 Tax=Nocardia vinacea TaxID=96468 RepID=UPI0005934EBC|nr:hypothetical protein [Nocardia vinacea]
MPNSNGQLWIRTSGNPENLVQLLDWFRHDDALRGRISPQAAQIRSDEMGGLTDVLVLAASSGGIGVALVRSLTVWLTHRRTDITVTVTRANGDKIELDAKRVDSTEVLQQVQRLIDPPDVAS